VHAHAAGGRVAVADVEVDGTAPGTGIATAPTL
jgi:hypothetical protein